jgi:hypothetical protein
MMEDEEGDANSGGILMSQMRSQVSVKRKLKLVRTLKIICL